MSLGRGEWDCGYGEAAHLMEWETIRPLATEATLGSHGCSHPRLSAVAPEDLAREVEELASGAGRGAWDFAAGFCYPYADFKRRGHGSG